MPNYKYKNFYKTLLQIWLFYYFLNSIKVHRCQMNDVEFISQPRNDENDVSDETNRKNSDSDYVYEPIDTNHPRFNFDDDIDERKNVNLNVNNNLHETENIPQAGDDSPRFTEINERQISGEKTLLLSESPYLLRQDLEVLQNARLNVEAGVTIHFAPMVGITVHGQLKAIVSISLFSLRSKN